MATRTYELSLKGLPVPDGEIDVRDLVAILEPLRLTAVRVARQVGGSARTGRTASSLDAAGGLRFKATRPGSTVLEFALGDAASLPGMPDEDLIADRFEELVAAIASNDPPEWVNPPVAAACRRTAAALHACGASEFTLARLGNEVHDVAAAATDTLDAGRWQLSPEATGEVTVSGRLDMVDIRQSHFRIRDDTGNDIHLLDVSDAADASQLVGRRVVATAFGERDDRGRLRLVDPSITVEELPASWSLPAASGEIVGVPVADLPRLDIDEDEIEAFLAEIRG